MTRNSDLPSMPKVVRDACVDDWAANLPLVLGVAHGDEQRAFCARDDDLGVDPERHHHVLAVEVEVAEVREVACIGDHDFVARGDEDGDQILWCRDGSAVDLRGSSPALRGLRLRSR